MARTGGWGPCGPIIIDTTAELRRGLGKGVTANGKRPRLAAWGVFWRGLR